MSEFKITPHHLPRGTVFETHLYRPPVEGEIGPQWSGWGEHPPAVFTVDHVLVVDGWCGRNYMVVTTTPAPLNNFSNEKYISFNVDNVTRVVKHGHATVFKNANVGVAPYRNWWNPKGKYSTYEILSLFGFKLRQQHPLIQFDIDSMLEVATRCGVISIKTNDPASGLFYRWYYITNTRKLNTWMKRNKNRFIYGAKELALLREAALEEERRHLEDVFDQEYLGAVEGERVADYPENLGEAPVVETDYANSPFSNPMFEADGSSFEDDA
jgi:hypothetical protein